MKTMRRRLNLFKHNSTRFNQQLIYSKEFFRKSTFVCSLKKSINSTRLLGSGAYDARHARARLSTRQWLLTVRETVVTKPSRLNIVAQLTTQLLHNNSYNYNISIAIILELNHVFSNSTKPNSFRTKSEFFKDRTETEPKLKKKYLFHISLFLY